MLPYFRKTEHHHDPGANPNDHGLDGGMYTCSNTSTGRKYPLRQMVKAAWESLGLKEVPDANSGSPQGFSEVVENRRDGLRQLASEVYPLNGVQVITDTLVNRVIIGKRDGKQVAIGVELANGEILSAKKEIIISAGAYRTPQVLLLSGIGPAEELRKHGIEQVVNLPEVGLNLHDHMGVGQSYAVHSLDGTWRADISEQMEAPESRERLLSWFSSIQ
jgi:choline dehydrogenase-like flavoprotein